MGGFYGFTLHLVINDQGELRALCLTPGAVDDRRPVPRLARRLFGKRFGDRGAISQPLAAQVWVRCGLRLITNARRTMRERLLAYTDKPLRKQALIERVIERVIDQLKNICQIEHSRRLSRDYELLCATSEAWIYLTMIRLMLRRLARF